MTAILGFFQEIADGVRSFFDFLKNALDMIKMVGDVFSNMGDTLSMINKILPPPLTVAVYVLVGIITIIAIMKYVGFGGSVDD